MARLRSHVGENATFRNPTTGAKETCEVLDEIWVIEPTAKKFQKRAPKKMYGWRQAAFVVQLLRWNGPEKRVRITYWQRRQGAGTKEWNFGGQYAPVLTMSEYRALVKKVSGKPWK